MNQLANPAWLLAARCARRAAAAAEELGDTGRVTTLVDRTSPDPRLWQLGHRVFRTPTVRQLRIDRSVLRRRLEACGAPELSHAIAALAEPARAGRHLVFVHVRGTPMLVFSERLSRGWITGIV